MNGVQHDDDDDDDTKPSPMNAAEIIRTIDSAYAKMSTNVFSAARDAEEARENARVASAVVRSQQQNKHPPPKVVFGRKNRPPPPPPPPRIQPNKKAINAECLEGQGSISYENLSTDKRPMESAPRTPIGSYTPTERLSNANAEEMLALSLELERTKQMLEHEKTIHEDTKTALEHSEEKNGKLQHEIEKLLNELETQRQNYGLEVESLERDLEKSRRRVQAAEEDAEVALDLAKGNSESREQLEAWLQRAFYEIETLRERLLLTDGKREDINGTAQPSVSPGLEALHHAPKNIKSQSQQRVVRFADDEDSSEMVPLPSRPSRKLVAAGRQILQRSLAPPKDASPIHRVVPPELSADRLRQLRSRLTTMSVSQSLPPPPPGLGPMRKEELVAKVQAIDVCRNTARILRQSGKKLQFTGKCFDAGVSFDVADDFHLETLARQYCAAAEVSIDNQRKEILGLTSLVSLWEQSLPSDTKSIHPRE
ncbi:hypothetical protein FisN_8Lh164 [Fistulifera solaris]|uniref:Uncharacterized protein n=1 Tax=Fistulifera solaris TaxID=1519565 RepID=A0A1Z5JDV1_FISSO|nr:hypothetical protein FisN_8Lh164 [Fistulifera solaris]|eukprot:GAX12062.1 hypothetical protein FisN_8Lh164 [Fistulifera solaris]